MYRRFWNWLVTPRVRPNYTLMSALIRTLSEEVIKLQTELRDHRRTHHEFGNVVLDLNNLVDRASIRNASTLSAEISNVARLLVEEKNANADTIKITADAIREISKLEALIIRAWGVQEGRGEKKAVGRRTGAARVRVPVRRRRAVPKSRRKRHS